MDIETLKQEIGVTTEWENLQFDQGVQNWEKQVKKFSIGAINETQIKPEDLRDRYLYCIVHNSPQIESGQKDGKCGDRTCYITPLSGDNQIIEDLPIYKFQATQREYMLCNPYIFKNNSTREEFKAKILSQTGLKTLLRTDLDRGQNPYGYLRDNIFEEKADNDGRIAANVTSIWKEWDTYKNRVLQIRLTPMETSSRSKRSVPQTNKLDNQFKLAIHKIYDHVKINWKKQEDILSKVIESHKELNWEKSIRQLQSKLEGLLQQWLHNQKEPLRTHEDLTQRITILGTEYHEGENITVQIVIRKEKLNPLYTRPETQVSGSVWQICRQKQLDEYQIWICGKKRPLQPVTGLSGFMIGYTGSSAGLA